MRKKSGRSAFRIAKDPDSQAGRYRRTRARRVPHWEKNPSADAIRSPRLSCRHSPSCPSGSFAPAFALRRQMPFGAQDDKEGCFIEGGCLCQLRAKNVQQQQSSPHPPRAVILSDEKGVVRARKTAQCAVFTEQRAGRPWTAPQVRPHREGSRRLRWE